MKAMIRHLFTLVLFLSIGISSFSQTISREVLIEDTLHHFDLNYNFSQKLIDEILPSGSENKLITGIILVFLLLLFRVILNRVQHYFLAIQTREFNIRIVHSFFFRLLTLPKSFFDVRKIGDIVARLNDTQRIQKVIGLIVGNSFVNLFMFCMFYYLIFI